jgi:hypothetical protein
MKHVLLLLVPLLVTSCTRSLIYDPSLQLPSMPLKPGGLQVALGAAYLPETRPDTIGRMGVVGVTSQLRVGFSDYLTVGAKYWSAFSNLPDGTTAGDEGRYYRGGLSGELAVRVSDSSATLKRSVIARSGLAFGEGPNNYVQIDGGGVALQYALTARPGDMMLSAAIGGIFGFHDFDSGEDQWGLGGIVNLGASYELFDGFDVVADLSALLYYDANQPKTVVTAAPAISISYSR